MVAEAISSSKEESAMFDIGIDHASIQQKIREGFLHPVRQILTNERIYDWCRRSGHLWRNRCFCPTVSLLACVWKQLDPVSARDVEDRLALLAPTGKNSLRDGRDFCNARARLPIPVLQLAVKHTGTTASSAAEHRYNGFKICIADGTTAQVPRTEKNQSAFRASSNQHGKSRHPLLRLVILVCAGCGAILDLSFSPYVVAEARLFFLLIMRLLPNMLVIADTTACSYLSFAMSRARGSHMLC